MKFYFLIFLLSLFLSGNANALCVIEKDGKLRKGPSTKYPVTWKVIRYMPVKKISKKDGWYRVQDVDGEIHWAREDILTSKFQCATIKEKFANLRKGPSTKAKLFAKGDRYLSFRVLKIQDPWVKLEDVDGDEAWVLRKLVWIN